MIFCKSGFSSYSVEMRLYYCKSTASSDINLFIKQGYFSMKLDVDIRIWRWSRTVSFWRVEVQYIWISSIHFRFLRVSISMDPTIRE